MAETVTLQLPNDLASTAHAVAEQARRPLEEVLLDWLAQTAASLPVESLTDEQVLALSQMEMTAEQQELLSHLLGKHQEGRLEKSEQHKLDQLMQLYRRGLIRKAEAFHVAVSRGLIPPLN